MTAGYMCPHSPNYIIALNSFMDNSLSNLLARLPYRNNTCINKCAAYSVNTGTAVRYGSFSRFLLKLHCRVHSPVHCKLSTGGLWHILFLSFTINSTLHSTDSAVQSDWFRVRVRDRHSGVRCMFMVVGVVLSIPALPALHRPRPHVEYNSQLKLTCVCSGGKD